MDAIQVVEKIFLLLMLILGGGDAWLRAGMRILQGRLTCGTTIMVRKKLSNKFNTNTILRNQLHKLRGNEQTTNKVSFYGDQYTLSISKK